jgi:hypothetical protein
VHQRADTIVEGLSVKLYVQKKGAFNRGGQQAPIEFRGKTTKDVVVQHRHPPCSARLATTFDRRQLNAVNGRKKTDLSGFYVTPGSQVDRASRLFLLLFVRRGRGISHSGTLNLFGYQALINSVGDHRWIREGRTMASFDRAQQGQTLHSVSA